MRHLAVPEHQAAAQVTLAAVRVERLEGECPVPAVLTGEGHHALARAGGGEHREGGVLRPGPNPRTRAATAGRRSGRGGRRGDHQQLQIPGVHMVLQAVERPGSQVEADGAVPGAHQVAALRLPGPRVGGAHHRGSARGVGRGVTPWSLPHRRGRVASMSRPRSRRR